MHGRNLLANTTKRNHPSLQMDADPKAEDTIAALGRVRYLECGAIPPLLFLSSKLFAIILADRLISMCGV
jgi:hypothetical protein